MSSAIFIAMIVVIMIATFAHFYRIAATPPPSPLCHHHHHHHLHLLLVFHIHHRHHVISVLVIFIVITKINSAKKSARTSVNVRMWMKKSISSRNCFPTSSPALVWCCDWWPLWPWNTSTRESASLKDAFCFDTFAPVASSGVLYVSL